MKNLKKISNYSIAGLLALGVIVLGFFAYQSKIQADTVVPGFATAHISLNVMIPDARAVPFMVKFLPQDGSPAYYFKARTFAFSVPGLNTVEWYIRKIPQGDYKVIVDSSGIELGGSPVVSSLVIDKVNETNDFELNLGEPPSDEQTIEPIPDSEGPQEELPIIYESPATESPSPEQSPTSGSSVDTGSIPFPGDENYTVF